MAALNGHAGVVGRLNSVRADDDVLVPAIAFAELRYGALSSARIAENLRRIERLLDAMGFVPVDRSIAERFAEIKASLRSRGIAKSDADLLVAATAVERAGTLVSNDQAFHDGAIEDLVVEDWLA